MSALNSLLSRYRVATNPLRTQRKVELAVVLLVLVLCLQLMYSGARLLTLSAPAAVVPAPDALKVRRIHASDEVTAAQSGEIVTRPLFWESRRPLGEPVVVVKDDKARGKAGKLKGVKLLGVFGGGETAGIIVKVKDVKRRILLGEEIKGWTLESVEPDKVVLVADGRKETLALKAGTIVADSPAPAAKTGARLRGASKVEAGEDELSLGGSSRK